MCVHSLPMKTTKGLAHDVFVVLLPHILLVCDLTDTHWAQNGSIHGCVFVTFKGLCFNKQEQKSADEVLRVS